MPTTVQGVILARFDRLDRPMKRTLPTSIGDRKGLPVRNFKKITDIDQPIDHFLRGLEALDMIRLRSVEPELEYVFKHALTQEVVYNGVLRKERQEFHERIALVMEHLFQERLHGILRGPRRFISNMDAQC